MTENINKYKKKDKVSGIIVKTTLSGALVDIGGDKPAVIPISQLKKEKVKRVEDILKEGQKIDAWVRRIDQKSGRIELSLIEPLQLEWRDIKQGMKLKGTVDRIEKFGAFVNIGSERAGLIHVSEMSHDYIRTPEDVVKIGGEVEVQVLGVDRKKKQIKLSMKSLHEDPAALMVEEEEEKEGDPIPTAMESALRKAMGDDEGPKTIEIGSDKVVTKTSEMEDILARTLENRLKTKIE